MYMNERECTYFIKKKFVERKREMPAAQGSVSMLLSKMKYSMQLEFGLSE